MPNKIRRPRKKPVRSSRFRQELRRLSLADRCLFFMLVLLLIQSAAVLFLPLPAAGGEIDIIVRTASASIFGYLLGGGLSRPEAASASPLPEPEPLPPVSREAPLLSESPARSSPDSPSGECSRFRVLVTAGVGIFCLCALLLIRDLPGRAAGLDGSDSAVAVIVQFRDFISGSLGFLTGCASRSAGASPD